MYSDSKIDYPFTSFSNEALSIIVINIIINFYMYFLSS